MLQRILVSLFSSVVGVCFVPCVFFSVSAYGQADTDLEEVIIFSDPLNRSHDAFSQPIDVLTEDQLQHRQSASIGEVLSQNSGIHNAGYGSAVGRPVIRGLGGARVKILQNGLSSLDVASISPDHAVAVDSQHATQIEILKGPAALIFSSAAMGGVINVVDNRMPLNIDENKIKLNHEQSSVDNGSVLSLSGQHEGDDYGVQFSINQRQQKDYKLPKSDAEKNQHNSDILLKNMNVGFAWMFENVKLGMAFSQMNHEFALPGHEEHEEEHEGETEEEHDAHAENEEGARVALKQNRFDVVMNWNLNTPFWQALDWKTTFVDYQHSEGHSDEESEEEHEATEEEHTHEGLTHFKRKGIESRLSINYQTQSNGRGLVGVQLNNNAFSAIGGEAIVPNTDSNNLAVFAMHNKALGENIFMDVALRLDQSKMNVDETHLDSEHLSECGTTIDAIKNTTFEHASASAGIKYNVNENLILRSHLSQVSRAPQPQELYSCGAHESTLSFEIGNVNLENESAFNIDTSIEWQVDNISMQASFYRNAFTNFIYQENLNTVIDGLNAYAYSQQAVTLTGYEVQLDWIFNNGLTTSVFADSVEGKFNGGTKANEYVPRMPADRVGLSVAYMQTYWDVYVRNSYYQAQTNLAKNETKTSAFNALSLGANYMFNNITDLKLYVVMNNVLDKKVQYHTSFVKDIVAQPGRNIKLGLSYEF